MYIPVFCLRKLHSHYETPPVPTTPNHFAVQETSPQMVGGRQGLDRLTLPPVIMVQWKMGVSPIVVLLLMVPKSQTTTWDGHQTRRNGAGFLPFQHTTPFLPLNHFLLGESVETRKAAFPWSFRAGKFLRKLGKKLWDAFPPTQE